MANIERGEVDIEVNGKTYTLKLSMNAAVTLEQKQKKKIGDILADASALEFGAIREIMYVLLQKFHAAEFKTVTSVGDLIDDAGGVVMFFETLTKIAEANVPKAMAGDSPANPPQAQAGTGTDSSLTPAAVN